MSAELGPIAQLRPRLDAVIERARALEAEGLPFPTDNVSAAFSKAADMGEVDAASAIVKRAEALLTRASSDWTWVKELLRRADELRAIAGTIGVDLAILDRRVGNPRQRLMAEPLSSGSLEKAAASASLALAVLNDAVPKFCVQEADALGVSIRRARDRGEDVGNAARSFSRLLQALQDGNLATAAQRLVETRRIVARISRAPALPPLSPREEEEILLEARNLARRLQRIKGKARDAHSAARLMAQVRAALSEERRYGTPEEEIEELWLEVDRITRERKLASEGGAPALASTESGAGAAADSDRFDALAPMPRPPVPEEDDEEEPEEEPAEERPARVAFHPYNPYIPPEIPGLTDPEPDPNAPGARSRARASRARP